MFRRLPRRSWFAVCVSVVVLVGVAGVDQLALGAPALPPPPSIVAQIPTNLAHPQPPGTSTGEVYGSHYFLAIIAQGGDALIYLCDGESTGLWFGAAIENRRFDVTTANGIRIAAALDIEGASGTVALPGVGPLPFETWTTVQGTTGLIRSTSERDGVRFVAGLIFVPDGGLSGITAGSNGTNSGTRVPRTTQQNTTEGAGSGGTLGSGSSSAATPGPVDFACRALCLRRTRVAGRGEATDRGPACVDFIGNGCQASCSQLAGEQKRIIATMQLVSTSIVNNNQGTDKTAEETNAEIKSALSGLQSNLHDVGSQMVANGCNN